MIAVVFCPRMLVEINSIHNVRLAITASSGTIDERACSKNPACAVAWAARVEVCAAVSCNHATYGSSLSCILVDVGPCQSLASPATVDPKPVAAVSNSWVNAAQASEAASRGADPGPAVIRNELISGGRNSNSAMVDQIGRAHV